MPHPSLVSGSLRKIDAIVNVAKSDGQFASALLADPDSALREFGVSLTQTEMVSLLSLMGRDVDSAFLESATKDHAEWLNEMKSGLQQLSGN